MAKFLTSSELNSELEKIFDKAQELIILISPYIKLHDRYASTLLTKKSDPNIEIIVVFGKNEDDFSKSMKEDDFKFFKDFPNIEIRHEKRLHAKYYANESSAILTSMNLYSYSQDVNIEAGVLTKTTLLGNLTGDDNFDRTAYEHFVKVIEQSTLLFKKTPEFENAMLGFSKKYKASKVEVDLLTDFFANKPIQNDNKKIKGFTESVANVKSEPKTEITSHRGFSNTKFHSITALSKELGLSTKELFTKFEKLNLIEKKDEEWVITEEGKSKGAQIKKSQYGEYIAWPETILNDLK